MSVSDYGHGGDALRRYMPSPPNPGPLAVLILVACATVYFLCEVLSR